MSDAGQFLQDVMGKIKDYASEAGNVVAPQMKGVQLPGGMQTPDPTQAPLDRFIPLMTSIGQLLQPGGDPLGGYVQGRLAQRSMETGMIYPYAAADAQRQAASITKQQQLRSLQAAIGAARQRGDNVNADKYQQYYDVIDASIPYQMVKALNPNSTVRTENDIFRAHAQQLVEQGGTWEEDPDRTYHEPLKQGDPRYWPAVDQAFQALKAGAKAQQAQAVAKATEPYKQPVLTPDTKREEEAYKSLIGTKEGKEALNIVNRRKIPPTFSSVSDVIPEARRSLAFQDLNKSVDEYGKNHKLTFMNSDEEVARGISAKEAYKNGFWPLDEKQMEEYRLAKTGEEAVKRMEHVLPDVESFVKENFEDDPTLMTRMMHVVIGTPEWDALDQKYHISILPWFSEYRSALGGLNTWMARKAAPNISRLPLIEFQNTQGAFGTLATNPARVREDLKFAKDNLKSYKDRLLNPGEMSRKLILRDIDQGTFTETESEESTKMEDNPSGTLNKEETEAFQ